MRPFLALIVPAALVAIPATAVNAAASAGLVPAAGGVTFRFTTAVKTPKGTHAGGGTVTLKKTGERAASLTISADGTPPRTIPLIVGVDGSIAPDPSAMPATNDSSTSNDPSAAAEAQAFMAEMTVAARVGIGARKNGGAATYSVPVKLAPVGTGTAVSSTLAMSGSATQYTGNTNAQTTTVLPSGGSLDPKEIAKTIGVTSAAGHAFGPRGRVASAVVMHKKRKEEKEAASGELPDTISLTVTATIADGKINAIRGLQTDTIALPGKSVAIESSWTFTRVSD